MKKALIIGISGQDGSLLAKHLLENNYKVYGTSRDYELTSFNGLKKLGIFDKVELQSMILNDFRSVMKAIFNPCSSECFGESTDNSKESTPFNPLSPYAVAKTSAYWLTSNYRKSYGIYTCSGILSNHESFLRSERFVTMKIINSAKRIYEGVQSKLELGNISIVRDWGCAEEYVKAMHLMLQQENPEDMIISTNKSISLEEFIDYTFKKYNLDYQKHIIINNDLIRPNDIKVSRLSNNKIFDRLGWKPQNNVYNVIDKLVNTLN
jgi:GDPmannose 4,6-dehydratase